MSVTLYIARTCPDGYNLPHTCTLVINYKYRLTACYSYVYQLYQHADCPIALRLLTYRKRANRTQCIWHPILLELSIGSTIIKLAVRLNQTIKTHFSLHVA